MSNPYIHDLLAQPEAVKDTLQALSGASDLSEYAQGWRSGAYSHVVLTGMGSSYHALHPLWLELVATGRPVIQVETSELIHTVPALLGEETLVIAVSQSGRSAEILRLLEMPRAALLAVTNSPESPLAQRANQAILTIAGEESTVSCKTYVTSLAALAVLGKRLEGQDTQPLLEELWVVPEAMTSYLESWQKHVPAMVEQIGEARSLMLAGRGASLAAVGTGALIIKEAAHFPAEGMSSAALRHGPLNMASVQLFAMVYAGSQIELNRRLLTDIHVAGGRGRLVVQSQEQGAFNLPPVPASALPMMEILPAQMLSLACAQLTGWQPGEFAHTGKVTEIE